MNTADFYGLAVVIFAANALPKSWATLCALIAFSLQVFFTFAGGA